LVLGNFLEISPDAFQTLQHILRLSQLGGETRSGNGAQGSGKNHSFRMLQPTRRAESHRFNVGMCSQSSDRKNSLLGG
jgi:hypothetical protein